MRVVSLASGSKGNAYVVEHGGAALLIDDGLSYKEFCRRLEASSVAAANFEAVLITHSHRDHVGGLATFLKHHDIPLYANSMTAEAVVHEQRVVPEAFVCFENDQDFDIGPFAVCPFAIPHDTSDPVGYLIRCGELTYFHGTDIGTPLDSIGRRLAQADFATLESNHDPVMLRQSGRAPQLIHRIAGPRGHLSNDQCCELVSKYASPRLKRLGLAHLSEDCNAPHLADRAMRETLQRLNRPEISLKVFSQLSPVEL